ncbi:hypothetical protein LTR74_003502 [Friedmanniomyces endolithicus]|nr:hypothetical protein LTR74_003502 [Friedmanniomyces endolithicus]
MAKSKPAFRPSKASVRSSAIADDRVRPSPLGQVQPRVHIGSNSVPVVEHADSQRRGQERLAELERLVQRVLTRDDETEARLSGVQDAVLHLSTTVRAIEQREARSSVKLEAGQANEQAKIQRLAMERLAHLERENLELRQRESKYQAQTFNIQEGFNRMVRDTQALREQLQEDTIRTTQMQNFLWENSRRR